MRARRKYDGPTLDPRAVELFIEGCKAHGIDPGKCCIPHGSLLVNLGHPDAARKKQAYETFVDELSRCDKMGIKLYNFHPGNSRTGTREEAIVMIAQKINDAHNDPATGEVVTVLETMASQGNTIGGTFADLAEIINLVTDKNRIGVCLDTCHVFTAGNDLRTPRAYASTIKRFHKTIGLKYLKAIHMNDSKGDIFSNTNEHARIGTRFLGLRTFHNIVNHDRLHGLPMILETPDEVVDENGTVSKDKGVWAREIKLLESLVGMDVESDEFKNLEAKLQEEGARDIKNEGVKKALDDVKTAAKKAVKAEKDKKAGKPEVAKARTKRTKKPVPKYVDDDASDQ